MGDTDRLKRLRELRAALNASLESGVPASPPSLGAPPWANEGETVPHIGARPSGAGRGLERPSGTAGPIAAPLEPCLLCGKVHIPGAPCDTPALQRVLAGPIVRGTQGEIPAERRGPGFLHLLDASLSPLSALENWKLVAISALLLPLGYAVALKSLPLEALGVHSPHGIAALTAVGVAALPWGLRFLSERLLRLVVLPGIRVYLTHFQWAPERHRAEVIVNVSCDMPIRGNWQHAVRVMLGDSTDPVTILERVVDRYDEDTKLDIALLLETSCTAIGALLVWLFVPDGRLIGLYTTVKRYREGRCVHCLGENAHCALCGGSGKAREAMF